MINRRAAGRVLLAAEVLAVASLTLTPRPPRPETLPFSCLVCGEVGGLDVLNNLIMLLPLGAAGWLLGWRLRTAMLAGLALSGLVEGLQAAVVPGRDASLSDLVTNTTSAGLGWLLMQGLPAVRDPAPRIAVRLAAAWSGLAVVLLWLGAAFVQPATPPGAWYAQWAPRLGNFDVFRGRVLDATLAGERFWRDAHPDRDALATRLKAGRWEFSAVAIGGARTRRLAPIVSVYSEAQRKVVILGQRGTAAAFTPRTRSEDWRFRSLLVETAPGAIRPGDSVGIEGWFGDGQIGVRATGRDSTVARTLTLSPTLLWAFVTPVPSPLGRGRWLYTAAWLALLFGPIGWWSAGRPVGGGALTIVVMATGFLVVPVASSLPFVSSPEWVLAGAAAFAGYRFRPRERSHQ